MNFFNKMLTKDSNIDKGIRVNPTVQQCGTQTIQQSIYLIHNNPCGNNLLIFDKLANLDLTFFQLKEILNEIMNISEVLEKYELMREKATVYLYSRIVKDQIDYLYAAMVWGQEATKFLPQLNFPGYRWRLSVFDYNGVMIWDSYTPDIKIITDNLRFKRLPLVRVFPGFSTPPNPPILFPNPFVPTGFMFFDTVQLYGLCNSVVLKYLDRQNPLVKTTLDSSFVVNQVALPEAMMAISSLLTDPANTRVFGIPRYGFSARQNTLNSSLLGYHCAYLNNLYSSDEKETLIETLFIRLSLEQEPLEN